MSLFIEDFIEIDYIQTLPSGIKVELEEWSIRDVSKLIASQGKNAFVGMCNALDKCKLVEDANKVYPDLVVGERINSRILLSADRHALLLLQRIYSKGKDMEFSVRCSNHSCDHYKKPPTLEVDLRSLLIHTLPEDSETVIVDGVKHAVIEGLSDVPICIEGLSKAPLKVASDDTLRALFGELELSVETRKKDKTIKFKLLTGLEEEKISKSPSESLEDITKLRNELARLRITEISPRPINLKEAILELPDSVLDSISRVCDEIEPSLSTEIDYECSKCGAYQEIMIPMMGDGFFSQVSKEKR